MVQGVTETVTNIKSFAPAAFRSKAANFIDFLAAPPQKPPR
jgi:hypothetical protein